MFRVVSFKSARAPLPLLAGPPQEYRHPSICVVGLPSSLLKYIYLRRDGIELHVEFNMCVVRSCDRRKGPGEFIPRDPFAR